MEDDELWGPIYKKFHPMSTPGDTVIANMVWTKCMLGNESTMDDISIYCELVKVGHSAMIIPEKSDMIKALDLNADVKTFDDVTKNIINSEIGARFGNVFGSKKVAKMRRM